jgi:hypothetical protein
LHFAGFSTREHHEAILLQLALPLVLVVLLTSFGKLVKFCLQVVALLKNAIEGVAYYCDFGAQRAGHSRLVI